MSRPGESVVAMMTVCQKCGDKGDSKRLVYCGHCQISAEHSYCLDKLHTTVDEKVIWTCGDCSPKDAKPILSPPRKSERVSLKKGQMVKRHRKWRLNERSIIGELLMNTKAEDAQVLNKEMKNLSSCNENSGNQELRKHRRRLVLEDVNSSDEEYEVKVTTSKSAQDAPHENSRNQELRRHRGRLVLEDVNSADEEYEVKVTTSKSAQDAQDAPHENSGNQELRKHRRRLVLEDVNSSDEEYEVKVTTFKSAQDAPLESTCNQPSYIEFAKNVRAQPIVDPIWRGGFSIASEENRVFVRLVAHLSSKSCSKVHDAAKALPMWLDVEILPRSVAWPRSFVRLPPKDDSIALYFFPEYERDEKVYDGLLDDIIEKDIALRAVLDNNVELLVFSSLELPEQHWRIQRKYYLWAVFRKRNDC